MNITTKKLTTFCIATALAATLATPAALAGHKDKTDYARVVSVEPITKIIRVSSPRQECWQEQVSRYEQPQQRSATPTIFGAVIGGLIGNELGHHKDAKKAGVVVGSVLGGSIGRDIGNRYASPGHQYYTTEQRCETYQDYHEEERILGYHVGYKYKGNIYHTRTQYPPGDRIKIRVSVTPIPEY